MGLRCARPQGRDRRRSRSRDRDRGRGRDRDRDRDRERRDKDKPRDSERARGDRDRDRDRPSSRNSGGDGRSPREMTEVPIIAYADGGYEVSLSVPPDITVAALAAALYKSGMTPPAPAEYGSGAGVSRVTPLPISFLSAGAVCLTARAASLPRSGSDRTFSGRAWLCRTRSAEKPGPGRSRCSYRCASSRGGCARPPAGSCCSWAAAGSGGRCWLRGAGSCCCCAGRTNSCVHCGRGTKAPC